MQGGLDLRGFASSHPTCMFPCLNIHIYVLYRGTEIEEQIQKRLRNAKAEMEQGKESGLFDHILVNDDLEACYEKLKVSFDIGFSFYISS